MNIRNEGGTTPDNYFVSCDPGLVMRHNNLIGTRHSIMSGHCLAPGNKGLINIYLCIIMRGKESLKVTGPCYYHHSNKKCFISAFVGCQICQNSLNATLIQQVLSVFTMKLKHCENCSCSPGARRQLNIPVVSAARVIAWKMGREEINKKCSSKSFSLVIPNVSRDFSSLTTLPSEILKYAKFFLHFEDVWQLREANCL